MPKTLALVLLLLGLALLACVLPGQPTPIIQCTAPACPNGDLYCPSGNCPGGCGTRCATHTPAPVAVLSPTPTDIEPAPMCTAPACQAGEVYYCPSGDCPGGCGTGCATPTPTLLPADFCQIVVRTPAPEAPTASVNGTPDPNQRVDPHVETCLSATEAAVGDRLALVGQAVDIGLPVWTLRARENGSGEFETVATVSYDGQLSLVGDARNVLDIVDWQVFPNQVILHLDARVPGEVEFTLGASGEIHYGYPGPATWGGGISEVVRVVVR